SLSGSCRRRRCPCPPSAWTRAPPLRKRERRVRRGRSTSLVRHCRSRRRRRPYTTWHFFLRSEKPACCGCEKSLRHAAAAEKRRVRQLREDVQCRVNMAP